MKNLNGEDKEDNLDLRGLRATIFCCNTASDTTVNQLRSVRNRSLPLLELIICSTISAAPRACSLAC